MTDQEMFALAMRWARDFAAKNRFGAHIEEDLVQEAAMAIIKAKERHRPEKGNLHNYAKLWAWALMKKYANAHGSVVRHGTRAPQTKTLVPQDTDNDAAEPGTVIDTRTESGNAHETAVARQAMSRTKNDRQYAMVTMRIEGYTLDEIGATFGVSREFARQQIVAFGEVLA